MVNEFYDFRTKRHESIKQKFRLLFKQPHDQQFVHVDEFLIQNPAHPKIYVFDEKSTILGAFKIHNVKKLSDQITYAYSHLGYRTQQIHRLLTVEKGSLVPYQVDNHTRPKNHVIVQLIVSEENSKWLFPYVPKMFKNLAIFDILDNNSQKMAIVTKLKNGGMKLNFAEERSLGYLLAKKLQTYCLT